jgi:hypothetical protein
MLDYIDFFHKTLQQIQNELNIAEAKQIITDPEEIKKVQDNLTALGGSGKYNDLLERAKKQGFNSVEEYLAWQKERSKGSDVGLEGMGSGTTKAGKSCRTETGDSTKRIR